MAGPRRAGIRHIGLRPSLLDHPRSGRPQARPQRHGVLPRCGRWRVRRYGRACPCSDLKRIVVLAPSKPFNSGTISRLILKDEHAVIDRTSTGHCDLSHHRVRVEAQNKTVLTGLQTAWPPPPPQEGRRLLFRLCGDRHAVALALGNLLRRRSRRRCGRRCWAKGYLDGVRPEPVDRRDGVGLAAERCDFGGISGGPMLSVIERNGIRSWALAGVSPRRTQSLDRRRA